VVDAGIAGEFSGERRKKKKKIKRRVYKRFRQIRERVGHGGEKAPRSRSNYQPLTAKRSFQRRKGKERRKREFRRRQQSVLFKKNREKKREGEFIISPGFRIPRSRSPRREGGGRGANIDQGLRTGLGALIGIVDATSAGALQEKGEPTSSRGRRPEGKEGDSRESRSCVSVAGRRGRGGRGSGLIVLQLSRQSEGRGSPREKGEAERSYKSESLEGGGRGEDPQDSSKK